MVTQRTFGHHFEHETPLWNYMKLFASFSWEKYSIFMNYQDVITSGNEQLQAMAYGILKFRSMLGTVKVGTQVCDSWKRLMQSYSTSPPLPKKTPNRCFIFLKYVCLKSYIFFIITLILKVENEIGQVWHIEGNRSEWKIISNLLVITVYVWYVHTVYYLPEVRNNGSWYFNFCGHVDPNLKTTKMFSRITIVL